jgi:hypothetical protein
MQVFDKCCEMRCQGFDGSRSGSDDGCNLLTYYFVPICGPTIRISTLSK